MIRIVLPILIVFVLLGHYGFSQDITSANLSWAISRIDNRTTGMFDDGGGTLQSYGAERVEWQDTRGTLKQIFIVHEVNGQWTNVANTGTIIYEGENEGKSCTITFLRDGNGLRVTIGIFNDDDSPLIYEFTIQNLTTL